MLSLLYFLLSFFSHKLNNYLNTVRKEIKNLFFSFLKEIQIAHKKFGFVIELKYPVRSEQQMKKIMGQKSVLFLQYLVNKTNGIFLLV